VQAEILLGGCAFKVDLAHPVELAIELDFAGPQPRHFGAPRASARAFETEGFNGAVARGASCNCDSITLIPHCNGTHTESVGHLTRERFDAWRVVPEGLLPALLVSVTPEVAGDESSDPAPQPTDTLITAAALERAWPARLPFAPAALIVRTLPNLPDKRARDYSGEVPPYLSREAAQLLLARDILHLVVDTPSIDRSHDEGRLSAHRIFFGLPAQQVHLASATRRTATVTELAFIPDAIADGACLLELQVPALGGDAVPSRPLLYRLAESA
jgi:arylformamidase